MATPPPDVTKRLAALSPARRELVSRLLARGQRNDSESRAPQERREVAPDAEDDRPLTFDVGTTATEAKAGVLRFYNTLSRQLDGSEIAQFALFLNYGYAPNGEREFAQVTLPEHYLNKNSVKLVLELIGDVELTDRRVLDVGCGRGGTAHVIDRFFRPRRITGVDLSPVAIAFCRRVHTGPLFEFHVGDAERLPFEDESFDVVTNVESSHCYPDVGGFYREVHRVLTPRGCFLYTDLLTLEQLRESRRLMPELGFVTEHDRDISANVLLSCDQIARTRLGAFGGGNEPNLMREFLAAPGSDVYEGLRLEQSRYCLFRFRKDRPAR